MLRMGLRRNALNHEQRLRSRSGYWRFSPPNVPGRDRPRFVFQSQSFRPPLNLKCRPSQRLKLFPLCLSDCNRLRFDLHCRHRRSFEADSRLSHAVVSDRRNAAESLRWQSAIADRSANAACGAQLLFARSSGSQVRSPQVRIRSTRGECAIKGCVDQA